ncbi:MAG: LysR family transcriptional regulator [Oscillospiraceae bacterium]|nr:LysR family transcriptional regulator [Oscillospiraceae bacterium]
MDLYQLDCFRTVARMEHISNAAVVLHVTQPALSKIISRVEDYAGTSLFDRVKGKIRLNPSGVVFLQTLDQVFEIMDEGKKRVKDISDRNENRVQLASSCDSILFMLAEDFFSKHPEVRVRYSVMSHAQIREGFLRRTLDFALTTFPLNEKDVEWEPIDEEEILLLVGKNSPFFGRKSVSFAELRGVEIMCEGSGDLRDKIDSCFETAGFAPNIVMENTAGSMMGFNAGLTRAVSFVPSHRYMQMEEAHAKRPGEEQMVSAVRLNCPSCVWTTGLAKRPNAELSNYAEMFYQITKEYFQNLRDKCSRFMEEYFSEE